VACARLVWHKSFDELVVTGKYSSFTFCPAIVQGHASDVVFAPMTVAGVVVFGVDILCDTVSSCGRLYA
jgi:hypothetical protein